MSGTHPELPLHFKNFSVEGVIASNGESRAYVVAPDAAAIIPVTDDGQILLIGEFREATGKWHWYLPAGRKQETDANMDACIHRELREETGYDVDHLAPLFESHSKSAWHKRGKYYYIGYGLFESPLDTGDETEKPQPEFVTPAFALQLLQDREIDDDMGDALYHFLARHVLTISFKENWVDAVKNNIQNNEAALKNNHQPR